MIPRRPSRPRMQSLRERIGEVVDSLFGATRGAPTGTALEAVSTAARGVTEDGLTLRLLAVRAQRALAQAVGRPLFSHSAYAGAPLDDLLGEATWAHEQFSIGDRLTGDEEASAAVRREMRVVREVVWWFSADPQLADAITYALDAAALADQLPANVVEALAAPLLLGIVDRARTDASTDGAS